MEINRQNIDIEKLDRCGVYELRNIARELGISRPTTLLRDELIEQIKKTLRSDEYIKPKSTRGRPPRSKNFDVAKILAPEPRYYESILEMPDDEYSANSFQVRSPSPVTEQVRFGAGYLHVVPRGHGVLISSCLNTYHVPIDFITKNQLSTGDHVDTIASWNEQTQKYHIEEITEIAHINFDTAVSIRPHIVKKTNDLEFKLGNRIVIKTDRNTDHIEQIANHNKEITDTYKIALLIEESNDCVKYLHENGIDEVYLVEVGFSAKKQLMLVLTALFTAKRHASEGKNVILFVDSLNKLHKLYNACSTYGKSMNVTLVNLESLTDLKTFFMSGKQLENGGSLTIVTHTNEPSSDTEKFVITQIIDLANIFLDQTDK